MSTIEQRIPRIEGKYYGGNQAWFPRRIEQGDGCGIMAAANLYFYYRYPLGSEPGIDEFMDVAHQLYFALKPVHLWNPASPVNSWGLPFFRRTMRRIRSFFFTKGILCKEEIYRGRKSGANEFIQKSLREGNPPILLLIGDPRKSPFNNHYLLITGIDDELLTVSTWGEKRVLDLNRLLKDAVIFRLGRFTEI